MNTVLAEHGVAETIYLYGVYIHSEDSGGRVRRCTGVAAAQGMPGSEAPSLNLPPTPL